MHRFVAGKTGWGKSWYGQQIMAANAPEYPVFVVLDHKDEYRGLVEAGLADWLIVGPEEADWSVGRWRAVFVENPQLVLARHRLDAETWREVAGRVVEAARHVGQQAGGAFVSLDESHILAPQQGATPSAITGLSTTGRGEKASSLWMTQRPALIEETVISQADELLLGGFTSDRDISKIDDYSEYPTAIHNPRLETVPRLPDSLRADGEDIPLRQFTEDGRTVGSEWVYSNDAGDLERRDTRAVDERTAHHGPEGRKIHDP